MLHSYTGSMEATTYLTEAISDTDTTIPVGHPSYITRGLIEVGNELMHVDAVGETSASLFPFARGAQNTTSIPHVINSRVTNDPIFPRQRIFDAMTRCMHNIQLDLFITKTHPFTYSTVRTSYEIPED